MKVLLLNFKKIAWFYPVVQDNCGCVFIGWIRFTLTNDVCFLQPQLPNPEFTLSPRTDLIVCKSWWLKSCVLLICPSRERLSLCTCVRVFVCLPVNLKFWECAEVRQERCILTLRLFRGENYDVTHCDVPSGTLEKKTNVRCNRKTDWEARKGGFLADREVDW